jgi:hypothetical protein
MFFRFLWALLLFVVHVRVQAQTINIVTVASTLPTPLVANTNYELSSSITLSGAGDYVGKGNTIITCNMLPCFEVNLATNGNVRFANVTFDLSLLS